MASRSSKPRRRLRSQAWFGRHDRDGFVHRSWMKNQGLPHDLFDGRPVIGICNTWSELTPCNAHFRELAEHVKRGVCEAGGFPLEFPVMSLGETLMRPTTMLFRNLASMDVEESIRANPLDGVVLLMGCDKTTPALLMGAASCDLPAIVRLRRTDAQRPLPRRDIGSGTARVVDQRGCPAGKMTEDDSWRPKSCMSRSAGHCMTMGTASTMAQHGRGAGHGAADQCRHSGGRRAAARAGAAGRAAHRRDGARGSAHVEDPDPRGLRERDPRQRARSAARPMPWSICWRWPAASASS